MPGIVGLETGSSVSGGLASGGPQAAGQVAAGPETTVTGLGPVDVEWAWRYHLGRRPTSAEVAAALAMAAGDAQALRLHVAGQPAALDRATHSPPPPQGKFFTWHGRAPRVLVLGNCQAQNIGRALYSLSERDLSIAALDITTFQRDREEFLTATAGADIILAPATSAAEFAEISVEALRTSTRAEIVAYVPVHFSGLYPDITYLGARGQRVASPIGDYNSRIVFRGFMKGLDPAACLASFNAETYAAQGYFDLFDTAQREWQRRETRLSADDLSLHDWFFAEIRDRPLLYSTNHPTEALFTELTRRLCTRLGLKASPGSNYICPNTLAFGATWPIAPELAAHHGLRYSTPYLYSNNTAMLSAEEFIWRSYRLYATHPRDLLEEAATSRGITL